MTDPIPSSASVLDPAAAASAIGEAAPTGATPAPAVSASAPAPSASGGVAPGTHDKRGVSYDPARHLPKMHPRHGGWMPRPQRGVPKRRPGAESPSPPAPADVTAAAPADPVASVTPTAPPAAPEPPPWSETERAAAAAGGAPAPGPEDPDAPAGEPAARVEDAQASPDALAEVVCNAVYTITGIITGHMKEARPPSAEHAGIKKTVAAYLAARGWHAVGGFAVAATAAAYFIRVFQQDGSAGVLRAWWDRRKAAQAKPAEPTEAPRTPAPGTPSAPVAVVGDSAAIPGL